MFGEKTPLFIYYAKKHKAVFCNVAISPLLFSPSDWESEEPINDDTMTCLRLTMDATNSFRDHPCSNKHAVVCQQTSMY